VLPPGANAFLGVREGGKEGGVKSVRCSRDSLFQLILLLAAKCILPQQNKGKKGRKADVGREGGKKGTRHTRTNKPTWLLTALSNLASGPFGSACPRKIGLN